MIKRAIKKVLYWIWILNSRFGRKVSIDSGHKATAIIPSYSLERVRNVEPLVRSLLKCDFVQEIIVSNHNPQISIEDWVKIVDKRLLLINQPVRRGCGYGWIVASQGNSEYVISIDDDMLMFPRQLAILFKRLVEQPEVPHGLAGRYRSRYCENQEMEVDTLFQVYAVTQTHLSRYVEWVEKITTEGYASNESIEFWSDDIIISQTGSHRPRIHEVGFIHRCPTTAKCGVAIHREEEFLQRRIQVEQALERVRSSPFP